MRVCIKTHTHIYQNVFNKFWQLQYLQATLPREGSVSISNKNTATPSGPSSSHIVKSSAVMTSERCHQMYYYFKCPCCNDGYDIFGCK